MWMMMTTMIALYCEGKDIFEKEKYIKIRGYYLGFFINAVSCAQYTFGNWNIFNGNFFVLEQHFNGTAFKFLFPCKCLHRRHFCTLGTYTKTVVCVIPAFPDMSKRWILQNVTKWNSKKMLLSSIFQLKT